MSVQDWRTAYGGRGVNVPRTREVGLRRLDTPAADEGLSLGNVLVSNRKETRSLGSHSLTGSVLKDSIALLFLVFNWKRAFVKI